MLIINKLILRDIGCYLVRSTYVLGFFINLLQHKLTLNLKSASSRHFQPEKTVQTEVSSLSN